MAYCFPSHRSIFLFLIPTPISSSYFSPRFPLVIFLLFVALTFVLARNLLKLFAERRLGVLGSKFRTRLVVGGLLLSFLPVIMMFWFAYGLMNRSIDKWFSRPVEEVREDTAAMASLLSRYLAQNAPCRGRIHCGAAGNPAGFCRAQFFHRDERIPAARTDLAGRLRSGDRGWKRAGQLCRARILAPAESRKSHSRAWPPIPSSI